jgi:glycosyltransferase involved in cell wall biosynthesis
MPEFLQAANIGVSFVPITPYYDMQPVTKTYEFLLAGMPMIATRTTQNKRFVNDTNGVLIDDTAESFADGLAEIKAKSRMYDSPAIQEASRCHAWESIILDQYIVYIEKAAASYPAG